MPSCRQNKTMKGIILNEKNIGLPPGTPVYVGDRPSSKMDVSVITYNPSFAEKQNLSAVEELPPGNDSVITWININGITDIDSIKAIAKKYSIHSLTVEDVLNTKQQPKVETFDNYSFISFKSIQKEKKFRHRHKQKRHFFRTAGKTPDEPSGKKEEFIIEQISIIIMKNLLITFQEIAGDPFDGIRKRILENTGRVRRMDSDYLAYALIDAVVDEYFLVLAHLEIDIENFEDRAAKTSDETFITEIQDTKNYLFQIRRAMLPLRDNLLNAARRNSLLSNEELKPFLQDLHENLNNAIDTIENCREWLSNIIDVNLSVLTYQLNKVMRTMTIITSIFIPLSFIAGVYGMNFQFMPELGMTWGYPAVLCCMGFVALGMILFFKMRRWF